MPQYSRIQNNTQELFVGTKLFHVSKEIKKLVLTLSVLKTGSVMTKLGSIVTLYCLLIILNHLN